MKRIFFLLFVFNFQFLILNSSFAQPGGQWTWMKGDATTNQTGVFGTQGVANPLNHPPGLYEAGNWTDLQGNFWLYGGVANKVYADLWKLDPSTNNWTWINGNGLTAVAPAFGSKGVAASTNQPGSRGYGMCTWTDTANNLWLLGGTTTLGPMNDLWKYDIATGFWTWVSGDNIANSAGVYGAKGIPSTGNAPKARNECTANWVDNANNLWLFGGGNYNNDLWRYNISTMEWTWMSGSSTINAVSVYGTKGVSAATNVPGARWVYAHWKDISGNLWLFGGGQYSKMTNDLWRYDLVTNEWTWMSGTNVLNDKGTYGSLCIADVNNVPASCIENKSSWTDSCGNFWLLGGINQTGSNQVNDLWQYSPSTNKWTWVNGDSTVNPLGNFGTIGVSAATNQPSNRCGSVSWRQTNGNLWLFGGFVNAGTLTRLSDLWRYVPDPACGGCIQTSLPVANFTSSDTAFCNEAGQCVSFFDHTTGNPTSWHWLFPGAIPDSSIQQNPVNICYYITGTYPVTLIVTNSGGTDTLNVPAMIKYLNGPSTPNITIRGGDTLISSYGYSYQWFLNGNAIAGAIDSFYIAHQSGTYSVRVKDSLGCSSLSNGEFITSVYSNQSTMFGIKIYPNPAGNQLMIDFGQWTNNCHLSIYNVLGEEISTQQIQTTGHKPQVVNITALASGMYFLKIESDGDSRMTKFVKE